MALITENFTAADGTNLSLLSGWNLHSANADDAFVNSNRLTKSTGAGQHLSYHSTSVTGNGYVEISLTMMTAIAVNAGLAISINTGADDYVYARHNQSNGEWSIRSVVASTATPIGTATETLVGGDTRTVRLERRTVTGPHDEYRLLVAGVQVIGWTQSDGHTGTKVGVRFGGAASSTTGYAIDSLTADVTAAATSTLGAFDPELRIEAWF